MSGGKGFIFQEFVADSTWTCPAGVTTAILIGMGGGQGGSAGAKEFENLAGTGGKGTVPTMKVVSVTPNTTYAITIGAGGIGAPGIVNDYDFPSYGSRGGNTTFGSLATFYGAGDGGDAAVDGLTGYSTPQFVTWPFDGSIISRARSASYSFESGEAGEAFLFYGSNVYGLGGTGGAAGLTANGVNGGNAAIGTGGAGQNANVNNKGAGGGGGGASRDGTSGAGGKGAPGKLTVIWVNG